jgi:hypothetical protein
MGTVKVQGPGLELGELLRDVQERARLESMKVLLKVGGEVVATSKAIASQHSKSIPASIKMVPLGTTAIEIRAGGSNAPLARLFELGNVKKTSHFKGHEKTTFDRSHKDEFGGKSFSHPVYGNKNVWVDQPRYPFLSVARREERVFMTDSLKEAWQKSLEPLKAAGNEA